MFCKIYDKLKQNRHRKRNENILYGMSDRELKDIGICRNDIPRKVRDLI